MQSSFKSFLGSCETNVIDFKPLLTVKDLGCSLFWVTMFASVSQRQVFFRKKLQQSSHSMRAVSLGQDRYRRRYLLLPYMGCVLVEGAEDILGEWKLQHAVSLVSLTLWDLGLVPAATLTISLRVCTWCNATQTNMLSSAVESHMNHDSSLKMIPVIIIPYADRTKHKKRKRSQKAHLKHYESNWDSLNHNWICPSWFPSCCCFLVFLLLGLVISIAVKKIQVCCACLAVLMIYTLIWL